MPGLKILPYFTTLLVILVTLVCRPTLPAAERQSERRSRTRSDSAERVLAQMHDAQAAVNSLVAEIEQVKSYPQLGIEDPAERGRFFLANGDGDQGRRVRLEIREPEIRMLTIQNGGYLLYQPRIKQAVRGRLTASASTSMFSGVLTGSPGAAAALSRDYIARVDNDTEVSGDAYRLLLTARAGAVVFCQRVDLWIDKTAMLPIRQACHQANESVVTFELSEMSLGAPIDDEMFDIELPEDVELIQN